MTEASQTPIRLLVIDDHQIVITGLKHLLKNNLPNVNIDGALSVDSLTTKIRECRYDLIILDINMPGNDTQGLIQFIKSIQESAKVLIYSMNPEEIFAKRYMQLGANGYLMKDADEKEVIAAIGKVAKGGIYISKKMMELMWTNVSVARSVNVLDVLTQREFEIMKHLVSGLSVKEIATITNLHHSTVSTHKAKIFEKTATKNILDLKQLADFYSP